MRRIDSVEEVDAGFLAEVRVGRSMVIKPAVVVPRQVVVLAICFVVVLMTR